MYDPVVRSSLHAQCQLENAEHCTGVKKGGRGVGGGCPRSVALLRLDVLKLADWLAHKGLGPH